MNEEMKELLTRFYVDQYREMSRKSKKKSIKTAHYMHRLGAKAKSISGQKVYPSEGYAVNLLHQDIKRLAMAAYYVNNKDGVRILNKEIIPHLVRLDLMLFNDPADMEKISPMLLEKMNAEYAGKICDKNIRDLIVEMNQDEIREQIMELVPSRPELEFPESLTMKRHFILHVGPTNSGKTYHSLERLKTAEKGVYLGPLRLLALEVYEKMMEENVPCTMLTGQECIEEPNSCVTASTVEMLDIDQIYDIAVIDEAQMVEDEDRGHSWTRAILGIRAKEIHVCMSPVAEDVIKHLISLCGDDFEVNRYERKTALELEEKPFEFPEDVQPGDAFIVFSKKSVLNISARLEEKGIRSSVIYGSLPPEIRRRQMAMFNKGQTKVVVSTDAIGMGLNLPVRRIVFLEMEKFDGTARRPLNLGEIKQIAGRAGRFGLYDTGYVTAMGEQALRFLTRRRGQTEKMISRVSLGFPQVLLDMDAPLDVILQLWHEAKPSEPFEKINIDDMLFLYREAERNQMFISDFDDKRILYRMVTCPIDIKDREVIDQWRRYCMSYTSDVKLDRPDKRSHYQGLQKYESYYKKLDLYYQFSVRLGKEIETEWLENERERTQNTIMQLLSKNKKEYILRCKYCGRILPIDSAYNLCEDCFGMKAASRYW